MVEEGYLTSIKETKQIHKAGEEAFTGDVKLDIDSMVSMNMWGFNAEFLKNWKSGLKSLWQIMPTTTRLNQSILSLC